MASKKSFSTWSFLLEGLAGAWYRILGPKVGWNSAKKILRIGPSSPQPVSLIIRIDISHYQKGCIWLPTKLYSVNHNLPSYNIIFAIDGFLNLLLTKISIASSTGTLSTIISLWVVMIDILVMKFDYIYIYNMQELLRLLCSIKSRFMHYKLFIIKFGFECSRSGWCSRWIGLVVCRCRLF